VSVKHNSNNLSLYEVLGFIVRVIKSRRMRWAGHVECVGEERDVWWGKLRERDHWGDPGVGGRIIFGWIFRKWDVGV
jgi:hypothetical protein